MVQEETVCTARTRARETDRFRSLGAVGVIPKPFDPMTLAASVREYVQPPSDPLAHLRAEFMLRVKRGAAALAEDRAVLRQGKRPADTLDRIKAEVFGTADASGPDDAPRARDHDRNHGDRDHEDHDHRDRNHGDQR